jgi:hypothetical protein
MSAILKYRDSHENVNIHELQIKYSIMLPPIYKVFAETFCLGEANVIRETYFSKKLNDYFDCKSYNFLFNNENIGFSHFIEIENAFEVYASGGLSDLMYEQKYFPIASSDGNGLYVGTMGSDTDKILWDGADGNLPKIISNNIFEFIRCIDIEDVKEEFLYGNVKHSQLYKNYGEDFWRVRDENI